MATPRHVEPVEREWTAAEHAWRRIGAVRDVLRSAGLAVSVTRIDRHLALLVSAPDQPVGPVLGTPAEVLLIFHDDHWVAGPNSHDTYLDYIGDQYLPADRVADAVIALFR